MSCGSSSGTLSSAAATMWRQVVGPQLRQRPLQGAADRERAADDDDGLGHGDSSRPAQAHRSGLARRTRHESAGARDVRRILGTA